MKKEKNNLERERESRLQDIHMKSLDRQRIDKLEVAKEKLEKQLKMMDSISKGHTHESEILKKALDCSRNVSEMYEERLGLDDDEETQSVYTVSTLYLSEQTEIVVSFFVMVSVPFHCYYIMSCSFLFVCMITGITLFHKTN